MNKLIHYAMNILAIKDYTEAELRRKLAAHCLSEPGNGGEPDGADQVRQDIEQAIEHCRQHDWVNDGRYAQRYILSRSRKGYGAQRIRAELGQKGVERETISVMLAECDIDWGELARETAERKFGTPLPVEWKEKAKLQRYLLYRGFSTEEIQFGYMKFED